MPVSSHMFCARCLNVAGVLPAVVVVATAIASATPAFVVIRDKSPRMVCV